MFLDHRLWHYQFCSFQNLFLWGNFWWFLIGRNFLILVSQTKVTVCVFGIDQKDSLGIMRFKRPVRPHRRGLTRQALPCAGCLAGPTSTGRSGAASGPLLKIACFLACLLFFWPRPKNSALLIDPGLSEMYCNLVLYCTYKGNYLYVFSPSKTVGHKSSVRRSNRSRKTIHVESSVLT